MLQTLLNERFQITKHNEPRVVAHYELVIAKGGLKIHPSKPDVKDDLKYLRGRLASQWMPMSRFTMLLSRQLREAVIDKTGLAGAYDIDIEWTPEDLNGAAPEASGPSVFSAIQDQLGLKLEAHRVRSTLWSSIGRTKFQSQIRRRKQVEIMTAPLRRCLTLWIRRRYTKNEGRRPSWTPWRRN